MPVTLCSYVLFKGFMKALIIQVVRGRSTIQMLHGLTLEICLYFPNTTDV